MLLWSRHGRLAYGDLREVIKPSAQSSYLAHGLKRLIASDFSAHSTFFQKKYAHAETLVIQMLPRIVYIIYPPNPPILGTKLPKCRKYGITIYNRRFLIAPGCSYLLSVERSASPYDSGAMLLN